MGFNTYFIAPATEIVTVIPGEQITQDTTIENQDIAVTVSAANGLISSITNKNIGQSLSTVQNYYWYNASAGNNQQCNQASGAYIFRPNASTPFNVGTGAPTVTLYQGKIVSEIRQNFSNWVYQVLRVYNNSNFFEFEATIGPIPINDNLGKEVIARFDTTIQSNNTWYSDSNGQDIMQRILNYRATWDLTVTEPVAGNYVPSYYHGYIKDANLQFTSITDRSRGCASLTDGSYEEMLHRRLLYDDRRGVGEPLNESEPIRSYNWAVVDQPSTSANKFRPLALRLNNPYIIGFGPSGNVDNWIKQYTTTWAPLTGPLPPNVHLLTFRAQDDGTFLFRVAHIYAINEDSVLSQPAQVDLSTLFGTFNVNSATEMSLTANQPLSAVHRMTWNTASNNNHAAKYEPVRDFIITLNPLQIRTFILSLSPK